MNTSLFLARFFILILKYKVKLSAVQELHIILLCCSIMFLFLVFNPWSFHGPRHP